MSEVQRKQVRFLGVVFHPRTGSLTYDTLHLSFEVFGWVEDDEKVLRPETKIESVSWHPHQPAPEGVDRTALEVLMLALKNIGPWVDRASENFAAARFARRNRGQENQP